MKKSKFIFGVATVLSLGIVATTVATYVSRPDDKVINIGGTTSTNGSLTLTLVNNKDSSSSNPTIFEQVGDSVPSTISAENLTKTINPYNKLHARYALGVSELVDYKEPVIYGQITLTVTTTLNWNDIELKAIVDGYSTDVKTDDKNPGDQPSYMLSGDKNVLKEVSVDGGTKVFQIDAPFSVDEENYGTQYFDLQVSLKETAINNYVELGAEKTLNYNVSLVYPPSSAVNFPYLVGTPTSWQEMEDYRLYPNILSDVEEFMLRDINVEAGEEFKVKHGSKWSTVGYNKDTTQGQVVYFETTGNGNAKTLNAGKMNVYYKTGDINSTWFDLTPNQ